MTTLAAAAVALALSGTAQAALIDQQDGTVRDDRTGLVWLKNWNVNGPANWTAQNSWAETGLDGFAGSNDWHLPTIAQFTDLFQAYGNLTQQTVFDQVQPGYYWSGTTPLPGFNAFRFLPDAGPQSEELQSNSGLFAVAVRIGSRVQGVPEPQSLAIVLLALGAMVGCRRQAQTRGERRASM